jgi:hypothetical protein
VAKIEACKRQEIAEIKRNFAMNQNDISLGEQSFVVHPSQNLAQSILQQS